HHRLLGARLRVPPGGLDPEGRRPRRRGRLRVAVGEPAFVTPPHVTVRPGATAGAPGLPPAQGDCRRRPPLPLLSPLRNAPEGAGRSPSAESHWCPRRS